MTPIHRVSIWDHSPLSIPTTCDLNMDACPNSKQAYRQSAVALYTKLQNMDMSKVPLFKTLLNHERSSQDGFQVLYAMLCVCHPKLVEKQNSRHQAWKLMVIYLLLCVNIPTI